MSTQDGPEEGHWDIRDTQSAYPDYFERQREAKCGMHALNNAIGRYQGSSCVARRSGVVALAYSKRIACVPALLVLFAPMQTFSPH